MQVKPIKTEADYKSALTEVDKLWESKKNSPNGDKLEVLVTLIESYEANRYPISEPDPVAYLEYLMESRDMTRNELGEYLGGKTRVSEILNRKRELSLTMIKNLHFKLGVSADFLIGHP